MDPRQFDRLTQALGTGLMRRGVLRGVLGAALAGPLALLGPSESEAKKKGHHKKGNKKKGNKKNRKACQPCKTKKDGKCTGTKPDGTVCPGGNCQSGSCKACTNPGFPGQCGSDANGPCFCDIPATGGPNVCTSDLASWGPVDGCGECPPDTICVRDEDFPDEFWCWPRCGAA